MLLRPDQVGDDKNGMHEYAFAQLERNPEWRLLLTAYHVRQLASADGWVDRIYELGNLDSQQLSRFHGRLIALGMLEFELGGRNDGMRYQLTTLGKQAQRGDHLVEAEMSETVTTETEVAVAAEVAA